MSVRLAWNPNKWYIINPATFTNYYSYANGISGHAFCIEKQICANSSLYYEPGVANCVIPNQCSYGVLNSNMSTYMCSKCAYYCADCDYSVSRIICTACSSSDHRIYLSSNKSCVC